MKLHATILLASTILTSPCLAATITVHDGESIEGAAAKAQSGDIVLVEAGTYEGGIHTSKEGVSYKANGDVVIKGGSTDFGWRNDGASSNIDGFKLDGTGTQWRIGLWQSGSNSTLSGNAVANVGQGTGCSSQGGAGILTDSYHGGKNIDVIGNTVTNTGVGKCNFVQGIYIQAPESEIRGNKVDKVSGWGIQGWHDAGDLEITGNTVSRAASGGIAVGGGQPYTTDGVASNVRITDNVVYSEGIGINPCGGSCGTGNVTENNTVVKSGDVAPGGANEGGVPPDPESGQATDAVSERDQEFQNRIAQFETEEERRKQAGVDEADDFDERFADVRKRYAEFRSEHDLCHATPEEMRAFCGKAMAGAKTEAQAAEIKNGDCAGWTSSDTVGVLMDCN